MTYWIVSSKTSHDASIMEWEDTDRQKWTTDGFLKNKRFLPTNCQKDFGRGDSCILNVYGMKQLVADFAIASEEQKDAAGDIFYDIDPVNEWDYPVSQELLPPKYKKLIVRSPSKRISETDYHELIGIRNFVGNLRFNYRNQLPVHIKETDVEKMMVSNASLKKLHLEIVEEQYELAPGNIIDFLCKDSKGDLVVVELKKRGADQTIGQLARYITDVRELKAKAGQKVRGVVLAQSVDEQLIKAARAIDIDVALYQFVFD